MTLETQSALDAVTSKASRLLPLNIQLFARSGDGGDSGNGDNSGTDGTGNDTEPNTAGNDTGTDGTNDNSGNQDNNSSNDDLKKIVQSKVDRAMADERKKNAELQKELEKAL